MSTSNSKISTEAAAAGALAAGLAVLCSADNPWLDAGTAHPAWLAVIVLAAFYGLRGLLIALPVAWAATAITALAVGADLSGVAVRATGSVDIVALCAALAVACITMAHTRRRQQLAAELAVLRCNSREDDGLIDALRDQVRALRTRCDRIDLSVSYWRDIAARIEGPDPGGAAGAAIELSLQRTAARAGIVRRFDGAALQNVAWRGRWSENMPVPRDIFRDNTMSAAIECGRSVLADEIADARVDDADFATPIRTADGRIVGVLALRGVARSKLREPEMSDVSAAAQWLATALDNDTRHPAPQYAQPATSR